MIFAKMNTDTPNENFISKGVEFIQSRTKSGKINN